MYAFSEWIYANLFLLNLIALLTYVKLDGQTI